MVSRNLNKMSSMKETIPKYFHSTFVYQDFYITMVGYRSLLSVCECRERARMAVEKRKYTKKNLKKNFQGEIERETSRECTMKKTVRDVDVKVDANNVTVA